MGRDLTHLQAAPPVAAEPTELQRARTRADLAKLLGVDKRGLNFLLYRLSLGRRYRTFKIKKRRGGMRTIQAPILPIKRLQERVVPLLEAHYRPRSCVYGYIKGRNIQQNAQCHVGKRWVLRVDLADFFPSINYGRVFGRLKAPPFELAHEVATAIAKLCCYDNELPQGSPASPLISNILCAGLDAALSRLARTHRCSYTRYCDDIVFSTSRTKFPADLAAFVEGSKDVELGDVLARQIADAGFNVNAQKVQLRNRGRDRQMVTGIVTNAKLNVPQHFLRDLRMMLHVWRKFGPKAAAGWYFEKYDKRNRPPGKAPPKFEQVVRGKLQYLGSVKGYDDPLYLNLAKRLAGLDSSFEWRGPTTYAKAPKLHVFAEGPTDRMHIERALIALQNAGRFRDLEIGMDGKKRGSADLLTLCKNLAQKPNDPACVILFDTDEKDKIEKASKDGGPRDWGKGVFSLVLPCPAHLQKGTPFCIELLYTQKDLQRTDANGRRLYRLAEFNRQNGRHLTESVYTTQAHRNALVIEEGVFDFAQPPKSLCLSKMHFAEFIQSLPAGEVSFEGFAPLFEALIAIRDRARQLDLPQAASAGDAEGGAFASQ